LIGDEKNSYLRGSENEPLEIIGTIQVDRNNYLLVRSLVQSHLIGYKFLVLFTDDGHFTGSIALERISDQGVIVHETKGQIGIRPVNTTFELVKDETIDTKAGFTNYEIIFTGVTKDTINLLYREYTSDDLARPAFYQNLTYPVDALFIRFKQLKIKVLYVNDESIKYAVVEDK
jgi:hypothetical protein